MVDILCRCGEPFIVKYVEMDRDIQIEHKRYPLAWINCDMFSEMGSDECAKYLMDRTVESLKFSILRSSRFMGCEVPW